jgi:proline iminopeptidase
MPKLYQHQQAFRKFHLAVGQGHQIEVEEWGNPHGAPVFICHGGPGFGICTSMVRFFNPSLYRIVFFSQRGCKGSTPHSIDNNTSDLLVGDIELLRTHLGIEKMMLAGGSWGATLALLYAIKYPAQVSGLLLWATFLAGNDDFEWLYGCSGAGAQFYPEVYGQFNPEHLPWPDLLKYYYARVFSDDEIAAYHAAKLWLGWENVLLVGNAQSNMSIAEHHTQLNHAKIMLHYFINRCFIQGDDITQLSQQLADIPLWMVHGRYDLICRFSSAQAFAAKTGARLLILDGIGHSIQNGVYCDAICRAADLLYIKLNH